VKPVPTQVTRDNQPTATSRIRAAKAVARDEGVSSITIWRRVRAGLLTGVNIAGRLYITIDSLELFYERAMEGEFSQPAHGCAGASAKKRAAKETAK
jgi:hypothetical protein